MFVLLYRVCTHVELGVLATGLSVYVCVGVEGMYTCKTGIFGNNHFCLCYLLLYRVCTHVRLGILANYPLCLCLCGFIGYVHM